MGDRLKTPGPTYYRIRLKEVLNGKWSEWLGSMEITTESNETVLTGEVPDQAALHGLLIKIRDLNLHLLSLERIDPDGR